MKKGHCWGLGKPRPDKIKDLLKLFGEEFPPEVLVGPRYGEDSAVVRRGEDLWVFSSDPITFSSKDQGYYLVNVNANDVATMGARPLYLLLVMLLPEGKTDDELACSLIGQVKDVSNRLGITVLGGHTEVSPGLDRPILIGTVIGIKRGRVVTSSDAEPGDLLLLTKGIAIEGTSIIAREKEGLVQEVFGREKVDEIKDWIKNPGISIVKEALILSERGLVKAMHDPTEGGLAMGVHELAEASGVGVEVIFEEIPIYEETRVLTKRLNMDPLGLIASGSLLFTVDENHVDEAIGVLEGEGIKVSVIGRIKEKGYGVKLKRGKDLRDLPFFSRDEILKI